MSLLPAIVLNIELWDSVNSTESFLSFQSTLLYIFIVSFQVYHDLSQMRLHLCVCVCCVKGVVISSGL